MVYQAIENRCVRTMRTHAEDRRRLDSEFSFQTKGLMIHDKGPPRRLGSRAIAIPTDAQTIDQMDLKPCSKGPAVCLDSLQIGAGSTSQRRAPSTPPNRPAGSPSRPGDIFLLLHTGTYTRYAGTPQYLRQHPGLGVSQQVIAARVARLRTSTARTGHNPTGRISHAIDDVVSIGSPTREPRQSARARRPAIHLRRLRSSLIGGHGGPTRAVDLLD